jgi:hypothetical protein
MWLRNKRFCSPVHLIEIDLLRGRACDSVPLDGAVTEAVRSTTASAFII